ncbi:MAG TPA: isoprenylcysteine carboxylmethyltransferase family protein [Rhizomicrobium sp.]|jgi:protein-S-isoprenylcysteine O-methyltransferase Ste14|nr:isoprenylcysteine carboxylmethyltransferase family protein [Rhizomicrobium sp.]
MRAPRTTKFESTKAYDVLAASPLILFYVLSIFGLAPQFPAALALRPAWFSGLQIAVLASDIGYFTLVVALVLLRRMPVAKSHGMWPRLVALFGANLLIAVALLPKQSPSVPMAALAAALTGGGTLAEIAILFWLGRSFTILPEARRLVTKGPYRFVRHPLYLISIVASVGTMIQFQEPWAFFIVLAADVLQLARIHYEEQVLRDAFPEYADYAARTWRLVPGLY